MHEKGRILGQESYRPYYTDKDSATDNNYIHGYESKVQSPELKNFMRILSWIRFHRFHAEGKANLGTNAELREERRLPWLALNEVSRFRKRLDWK